MLLKNMMKINAILNRYVYKFFYIIYMYKNIKGDNMKLLTVYESTHKELTKLKKKLKIKKERNFSFSEVIDYLISNCKECD